MSEGSMGNPPDITYRLTINRRYDWFHHWRCTLWRIEFVFEECMDMEDNTRWVLFCIVASNALLLP